MCVLLLVRAGTVNHRTIVSLFQAASDLCPSEHRPVRQFLAASNQIKTRWQTPLSDKQIAHPLIQIKRGLITFSPRPRPFIILSPLANRGTESQPRFPARRGRCVQPARTGFQDDPLRRAERTNERTDEREQPLEPRSPTAIQPRRTTASSGELISGFVRRFLREGSKPQPSLVVNRRCPHRGKGQYKYGSGGLQGLI